MPEEKDAMQDPGFADAASGAGPTVAGALGGGPGKPQSELAAGGADTSAIPIGTPGNPAAFARLKRLASEADPEPPQDATSDGEPGG